MNAPAADRLTTSLLQLRPAFRHRLNEDGQILSTLPADQTLPLSDVVGIDETHRGLLVTTLHGRFLFTRQALDTDAAPTRDPTATAADTHETLAVLLIQHGAHQQSAISLAREVLNSFTRLSQACDQAGIRDRAALALDLLAFFQPRP
ncbi:hypothetical protein [Deinococcus planocerae]|uniref:hypothetical protein n=1 Tax=Deinococcus planocerae TaxID=1737569 RepID=UPI000C7F046A|nr:hypothetical protein [Deinococcus planocerae]